MKQILFFLSCFLMASCSLENDNESAAAVHLLPIESVVGPESLHVGDTALFRVSYRRPTECYMFNDFYVTKQGNTHFIAVESRVFSSSCTQTDILQEVPFYFVPTQTGEYHLQFWQGDNDDAEPLYELQNITVTN